MLCFCHVEMWNGLYFALKSYTLSLHHPWEYLQLSMVRTLFVKWARNSNYLLQCMLSLIARLYFSRIGRKKKIMKAPKCNEKKTSAKIRAPADTTAKRLGSPFLSWPITSAERSYYIFNFLESKKLYGYQNITRIKPGKLFSHSLIPVTPENSFHGPLWSQSCQ